MELKKSKKADLENKKGLFFEIGLALSLLAVIGIFSVGQKDKVIEKFDLEVAIVEEEIMEITRQEQKPPEQVAAPVNVVSDIISIVDDDKKITTTFDFDEFGEDVVVAKPVEKKETVVQSDEPFLIVEDMPSFQGGDLNTFRNWVMKQIVYPAIAAENGIQGTVLVQFVIEKDGSLSDITVMQSPDRSLSEETTRILKLSPKWKEGRQRNVPVRVKYSMPVVYVLQQ